MGEGFDFSGVEAMASGGVVVASDIPVHREVYDGADYFDPYSTASLAASIQKLLYSAEAQRLHQHYQSRGFEVASSYTPDRILPKWREFLNRVTARKFRCRETAPCRHHLSRRQLRS